MNPSRNAEDALALLKRKGHITRADLLEHTDYTPEGAFSWLGRLRKAGLIVAMKAKVNGKGPMISHYYLVDGPLPAVKGKTKEVPPPPKPPRPYTPYGLKTLRRIKQNWWDMAIRSPLGDDICMGFMADSKSTAETKAAAHVDRLNVKYGPDLKQNRTIRYGARA